MLVKTSEEIEKMRVAGNLAASVLQMIESYVIEGTSTNELEQICRQYILEDLRATPSTLNHYGFPACICTSINHVVCHGIPSDKKLKDGDIINIDVTVQKDGYIGDTSKMFLVGNVKPFAKKLVDVTKDHKLSAQWEHTILVTDSGHEVLTLRPDEQLQTSIILVE